MLLFIVHMFYLNKHKYGFDSPLYILKESGILKVAVNTSFKGPELPSESQYHVSTVNEFMMNSLSPFFGFR